MHVHVTVYDREMKVTLREEKIIDIGERAKVPKEPGEYAVVTKTCASGETKKGHRIVLVGGEAHIERVEPKQEDKPK